MVSFEPLSPIYMGKIYLISLLYSPIERRTVKAHSLPGPSPLESGGLNSLAQIPASLQKGCPSMLTIRQEVQALVRATEHLLSPITLGEPLNEDERDMVAMCAQSLAEKYPISLPKLGSQSRKGTASRSMENREEARS
jgi:hypothetical protein